MNPFQTPISDNYLEPLNHPTSTLSIIHPAPHSFSKKRSNQPFQETTGSFFQFLAPSKNQLDPSSSFSHLPRTNWILLPASRTFQEPTRTFKKQLDPSPIFSHLLPSSRTFQEPTGTIQNQLDPSSIFSHLPKNLPSPSSSFHLVINPLA
ncbi:hypothetical protein [Absidia glauca]|uniref:Uncharacterized protein n=1 Tax=Absidia glauca TaxID=4829 RepID=A0A163JTB8_ABSGL|nr:hypothetical protein [Absidia glauca]